MKKKLLFVVVPLALLVVIGLVVFLVNRNVAKAPADTSDTSKSDVLDKSTDTTKTVDTTVDQPEVVEEVVYPIQLTIEQATAINVVVNKKHKLPENYVPTLTSVAGGQMRPEAAVELQKLLDAASASGISLKIISSYRSYNTQVSTYNGYVNQYGQAQADTFSARPGHSEHQTGLAVDLGNNDGSCAFEICFGATAGGQWLTANAANYGFIIRYPDGKETDTGYQYEPWHMRFLGVDTAKAVVASGNTLDQYYNVVASEY